MAAQSDFKCSSCSKRHNEHFLAFIKDKNFGNCEACGNFKNLTAVRISEKYGYQAQAMTKPIEAIRDPGQSFRAEVPMDLVLTRITEKMGHGRMYRPEAFYVSNREVFVDWMCDLAEKLRAQPETFHHSIGLFDAYLQRADITQHLASLPWFNRQSKHNIVTLIALNCIFISAKYLEKTYPGINQLLGYIGVPYNYDEFVEQEADMLNTLNWEISFVSIYDVL